ncbi:MAG TPA: hypothetical protein PK970_05615 [Hyphomicrobiaceae bacterium]|nr:hypothetical protein [Hyphomicrobiaceae bacterium]
MHMRYRPRRNPFRNRRQLLTVLGVVGVALIAAKLVRAYHRGDVIQKNVKPIEPADRKK